MQETPFHCPFLNRADARCAEHFSLDHLQHAFKHCFDRYRACPVYVELLVERRVRRAEAAVIQEGGRNYGRQPLVQVSLPDRYAKHAADGQGIPAVSGV